MKMLVHVREVWVQTYEVEVEPGQDPKEVVENSEPGENCLKDFEYSHQLPKETWTVTPA